MNGIEGPYTGQYAGIPTSGGIFVILSICCTLLGASVFLNGCISAPGEESVELSVSWNLSDYQEVYDSLEVVIKATSSSEIESMTLLLNGDTLAFSNHSGKFSDSLKTVWKNNGLQRGTGLIFKGMVSDSSGNEDSLESTCIQAGKLSVIPLAVGNIWNYVGSYSACSVGDTVTDSFEWKMEIRGTAASLDTTSFLFRVKSDEPVYDYNLNTADGFYFLGHWNYGKEEIPDEPLLVWKFPVEEPETYYSAYFDGSVDIVGIDEKVSVPAGDFTGCIHFRRIHDVEDAADDETISFIQGAFEPSRQRIKLRNSSDSIGSSDLPSCVADYYFKPGKGLVKMTFSWTDSLITTFESDDLTSYSIY